MAEKISIRIDIKGGYLTVKPVDQDSTEGADSTNVYNFSLHHNGSEWPFVDYMGSIAFQRPDLAENMAGYESLDHFLAAISRLSAEGLMYILEIDPAQPGDLE